MKRKSLKEVAKDLNISPTTVSFVLNGRGNEMKISKATQERIKEHVEKVNFRPNTIARGLSTGKTHTVGFIVPDISNPFYALIARQVENCMNEEGYHIIIGSTDEDRTKEDLLIHSMCDRQVDGIAIAPTLGRSLLLERLQAEGFPLVFFDRRVENTACSFVGIDNRASSFKAVDEILQKGYKNFYIVATTPEISTVKKRIAGAKEACEKHGVYCGYERVKIANYNNFRESVSQMIEEIFIAGSPEVIFFANNKCAMHGLWSLNRFHVDQLQQLCLMSFDDVELFDIALPRVSGIDQPKESIAQELTRILLKTINSPEGLSPEEVILKTDFILRS